MPRAPMAPWKSTQGTPGHHGEASRAPKTPCTGTQGTLKGHLGCSRHPVQAPRLPRAPWRGTQDTPKGHPSTALSRGHPEPLSAAPTGTLGCHPTPDTLPAPRSSRARAAGPSGARPWPNATAGSRTCAGPCSPTRWDHRDTHGPPPGAGNPSTPMRGATHCPPVSPLGRMRSAGRAGWGN